MFFRLLFGRPERANERETKRPNKAAGLQTVEPFAWQPLNKRCHERVRAGRQITNLVLHSNLTFYLSAGRFYDLYFSRNADIGRPNNQSGAARKRPHWRRFRASPPTMEPAGQWLLFYSPPAHYWPSRPDFFSSAQMNGQEEAEAGDGPRLASGFW